MINNNKSIRKSETFANIPKDLKQYKQWVAWRSVPRGKGKISKVPVSPKTGINASTNRPESWGSYDEAVTYYNSHKDDGIAGIGFVFTEADPFCGIDLDDCWDSSKYKMVSPFFNQILKDFSSYCEISPSGKGVKIFVKGTLPGPGRNFGNIEIYDSRRYFTVTGQRVEGYSSVIQDRNAKIHELYDRLNNHGGKSDEFLDDTGIGMTDPVESLPVSAEMKKFIHEGESVGNRSEAIMKVLIGLLRAGVADRDIFELFENHPIGEKYLEKGTSKESWLNGEIERAMEYIKKIPKDAHEEEIEKLNERHAVIMIGGRCLIMNEFIDPVFDRHDISFSSITDFNNYYANRKLQGSNSSISKLWIESPKRREYKGIIFNPGKDMEGYYNLYRGLAVGPRKGDWSLFKAHIRAIIANENKDVFKYLMAWMAHLVQMPGGERPGTAIVLRGKQGTGKGCFASQFGKIFGNHFLQINNQRQLTGRFNNHLKNALMVFVDEGIWAGDKTAEGVLKGMITEDHIMVEPKGKDPFPVKNHIRLIVASNSNWVVPAGFMERRFFVLDISEKQMQNKEYFQPIFEQMKNGGVEAMLYDLLKYDILNVDLRSFPRTSALLDQIISSMSPVEKFWFDRLREGTLGRYSNKWELNIVSEELHSDYQEYAGKIGGRFKLSNIQFGRKIKELCPDVDRKKMTRENTRDRVWHLCFPSLKECRKIFEEKINIPIDWDEI